MAGLGCGVLALALLAPGLEREPAEGARSGGVVLREPARIGATTQVVVTLKAEGKFLEAAPAAAAGESAKGEAPRPRSLKVETRTEFLERVLAVGADGRGSRTARRVIHAVAAINSAIRAEATAIRPEVALLVAERRDDGVIVFSPSGPLTRAELEVVEAPGDPLALPGLLPDHAVAVGDRWPVGRDAARDLSSYDALAVNALEATLESLDAAAASIRLKGEIRGAARGGAGVIQCEGTLRFDRAAGQVARLVLTRHEARKPGPVEAGLDIASTLTVERRPVAVPSALADPVIASLPGGRDPEAELLIRVSPDGKYSLRHDRDWHIFWDDTRLTVLKRLDHGEVIAQCNLSTGPKVPPNRHQDPDQFRDDVRRALGARFGQFLGVGAVDGDPAGGFRYKVAVQGRQGDVGIVWDYYLLASPEGDQLLATFTHAAAQDRAFGDQDVRVIGSLRWAGPARIEPPPAPAAAEAQPPR